MLTKNDLMGLILRNTKDITYVDITKYIKLAEAAKIANDMEEIVILDKVVGYGVIGYNKPNAFQFTVSYFIPANGCKIFEHHTTVRFNTSINRVTGINGIDETHYDLMDSIIYCERKENNNG